MSTRKPTLVVLALLLLFAGLRAADRDPRDREAREAFADHDYRRAVSLCRDLLAASPDDPAAEEWSMLVVRGLSLADEHDACAKAAVEFDAAYPDSRYREKVDFLAGRSLLLAGQGEAAAKATAAALDRLAGPERRRRLASLLVDAGKTALAGRPPAGPFDDGVPPDRDRALKLFGLARDLAGAGAMGDETRLLYAGAAVQTKGWDLALDLLDGMPESDPRVLLLSARAYLGRGDADAARATVKRLVREHPKSPEAPAGLLALDDPEHLARLVSLYPDHPSAPAAALRRGRLLVTAGRIDQAVLAFDDATARFPGTDVAAEAAIAAADALFAAGRYDEARGRYDEFLRAHPLSPEWARARERIAESFFRQGEAKLAAGDLDGAAAVWNVMRVSNPTSPYAAKSLFLEAAKREGPKAVALYRELLARHPKAAEAPAAALDLAQALADGAGSIAQAVEAYRRVVADYPNTGPAKTAAEKLAILQDESLVVKLPAPRRPGESPALEVRTRNLEKLEGRVWRLDPVEYVGKRGSFDGIADLLVDAIAPEKSFTVAVPDHEAYRESRFPVTVPVDGPGTFVVVLEGGKLKATGLLLVSGITVVTKESPHGVLAFVQEAGSGKPVEGAEVHVRDADGKVRHVATGSDGVARLRFPTDSGRVSVVATHQGSAAYEGFGPVKREVTALHTRIHVSTDRSLYRPGDTVKYRVVVRRASGGLFVTPTGEAVEVTVTDDAGNRLHDRKSNLSAFGTTAGEIELPADLPPDRYRIQVKLRDHAQTGFFVVEAYRKPQLFLEIEPERTDFLRGEEVRLAVTARHSFGAPARELPVKISFDGNCGRTARTHRRWSMLGTTDAEGRIEVTVPTAVGGSHFLSVLAEATDVTGRLYRADLRIPLFDAAFEAAVATNRESVFAGETVAVTVRTADHDGKPVAAKGALSIAHAEPGAEGFLAESKIAVATDEDGRAEVPFAAKDPGRYRFEWTGVDRTGREVVAAAVLDVAAPAADRISVRTDRTLYRVGESAKLAFELPAAGLWALATAEGEDVYDYRVVKFSAADATLEIALDKHHVPDAWLRVAVVANGRFYTGGQRVQVGRELVVTVTPEKRELAPGGKCRLTVKTTDDRGEPLPAEVAVAVVDEGIFLLRADDTPALAATFRPPSRGDLVRTGSSLRFSFTAITGRIPEDLLAERARRESGNAKKGVILEEKSLDEQLEKEKENSAIGIGGGAGGAFGGRGGHRNLRAEGGGMTAGASASVAPRSEFRDTAFWRADVVTGEDGTATFEFELPHDLTEWRITARGAAHGNAFGETRTSVLASLPLVVRAALPRYLRAGDETSPAVGVVNATDEAVTAEVGVSPARDADVKTETVEIPAGGEKAVRWDLPTGAAGELKVLARAAAGDAADAEARTLPVLPLGVAWRTGFSGDSASGGAVTVTIPDDVAPGSVEATLHVSPGLMSAALEGTRMLRAFPFGCTEQTVNRFWPALELAQAIRQLGLDRGAALPKLDETVVSGIRRLTYLRNSEGLWGWWGDRATNAEMTALALLALGRAKELGYDVPKNVLERAVAALPALRKRTTAADDRAFLLLGRSRAAGADFESLAPVFADRSRLSLRGLAFLLAAYEPLGKTAPATMLVEEIRGRLTGPGAVDTETLGWLTMALADAGAEDGLLRTLAAEIARRRGGAGFGTTRETGAVVAGVAHASWITGLRTLSTELRVVRNGEEILRTKLGGNPLDGRTIRIPADQLVPGANRIEVAGSGGRFGYSLAVRAVTRHAPADATGLDVARKTTLVAAPAGPGGGKDIVRKGGRSVEPEVSTVRPGEVVRVTLDVTNVREERYLVVEDPIPAGFEPVPDAAEGPFASTTRYEDRMVFFLESAPREAQVSYLLRAEVPGRVAAPPAIVYAMYEPVLASWSAEGALAVSFDGGDRDATAGLAARQLLDEAKAAHAMGHEEDAWKFVSALLDRYELEPAALAEALRLRAAIAAAAGRPADAVASWERMRAELPTVAPTFGDERAFAAALAAVGRHGEAVSVTERAAGVLFARERPLANALGGEAGEKLLDRFVTEFPFAPYTEEAARVRANAAAAAAEGAIADGKPLDDAALAVVRSFLVEFPESAAGAALDLRGLRLLLRAGRYEELVAGARRFGDRWPRSELVDDSEWYLAYGLFALDRYDEAEQVAKRSLPHSGYRSNLYHLLAQIAHARGNLDEAVRLYAKVMNASPDARAAYEMLTEKTLSLPEVTLALPGEPVTAEARVKNLTGVTLSFYPVDLLVWFTLTKDLDRVAKMNLLGLPPARVVPAPFTGPASRRETPLPIAIGSLDAGAWLVVAHAGDIEARGLLLVTDLAAEVRHDAGRTRVLVTDRKSGAPVPGAWVKVAVDGELVAEGPTDARGIFEAGKSLGGRISAVAKKGASCALAR